jgi:hypothetical protein
MITYGSLAGTAPGATAPATVGPQTRAGKERSTHSGVLTPLTSGSPLITIS